MTRDKKRKPEIDLTKDYIDLSGVDEAKEVKTARPTSSSASSSLSMFSAPSPDAATDALAEIFMARVRTFSSASIDLNEEMISQIIFEMAEDSFIAEMIVLRAGLYETAAAFENQNAITALKEFRLQHLPKLLRYQRYQVEPSSRNNSSEEFFQEIDELNAESTLDKFDEKGPASFLEDFFSDYIAEISVAHARYAADMLQRAAYQIGKAFADKKIPLPRGKRNEIAGIFISFAAEQGYRPAIDWIEMRSRSQASRQSSGPNASSG
jgi:hypothetical protein